jgi:hypothetical protein
LTRGRFPERRGGPSCQTPSSHPRKPGSSGRCAHSATPSGRNGKSDTRNRAGALGRCAAKHGGRDQGGAGRSLAAASAGDQPAAVARANLGPQDRRGAASRAEVDRPRRRGMGVRDRAFARSRRLGCRGQSGECRVALSDRGPAPARRRRSLG